jgi:hypothetical protein
MIPNLLRYHTPALTVLGRLPAVEQHVRCRLNLPPAGPLLTQLQRAGCGQADLALVLLRIGSPEARRVVEMLMRRRITVYPPLFLRWRYNIQSPVVLRPRLTAVAANPRKPGTRAHLLYEQFRPGRTEEQLRARGVRTCDLRRARRRGWIEWEQRA